MSTPAVQAQDPVIYSTSFDTLDGWTPNPTSGFAWAADATPNGVSLPGAMFVPPPGWLPYLSASASLNFNDGVSLGIEGNNYIDGFVTSPPIDLSVANRVPELRFMAAGWMELGWDSIRVQILQDPTGPLLREWPLGLQGDWSPVRLPLDRNWGTVRIRIWFETFDGVNNRSPGPFIDDLSITDRCDLDPMSPCSEFLSFCFGRGNACPCGNGLAAFVTSGCKNSTGPSQGAFLIPSGTPDVMSDSLRFQVAGAPPNSVALLASADRPLPMASPGVGVQFEAGLRCIGGNFLRHGVRAIDVSGEVGTTNPGWGLPDPPSGGLISQGAFVAGQSRYYQVFYRDVASALCSPGLNSTNGIKVTFR